MPQRTVFLSRLIGLYALIIAVAMIVHKAAMIEIAGELAQAPPLLLIGGMFTLLAGFAMVLLHNVWTGSAQAVVVTAIGWMMLIRGLVMVFVSPGGAAGIYEALRFDQLYYVYVAIPLVLGAYLAYSGFWASQPHRD
jgi:hypothetical protein